MGLNLRFHIYIVWKWEMCFLLPICDGTSKLLVNSITFTFASIDTWTDPLAAFAFAFALPFAFRHMETPRCVYMLF